VVLELDCSSGRIRPFQSHQSDPGPTVKTLAAVGDRAAALRADMLEAARRFDVSEDGDTLVLRMDYLEAVIHKPAP
jgi:hypothetical protein